MSSFINVKVSRYGNGHHKLLFDGNINDHYIAPGVGEGEYDYPVVSDTMFYSFQDSRIAKDIHVRVRSIEFNKPRKTPLNHVVSELLKLLEKHIGPRTFLVYMPR